MEDISSLRVEIANIRSGGPVNNQVLTKPDEVFSEMQDRTNRSNNFIMYNIPESQAIYSAQRILDNKTRITNIFTKIKVTCNYFKAFRLGRLGNRPRPPKVVIVRMYVLKRT